MSNETLTHLNTQTLIGFTGKRGNAWHYRLNEQGAESNHYEGRVPVEDVRRRLLPWYATEGDITATALTPDGVLQVVDPHHKAIMRSDTGAVLGIFKRGYEIHQYDEWLVRNVETLLDADLHIGSAGLLRGGAQAWVQIEMEDTLQAPDGIDFRPFLTAATSMDGSLATTYQVGAQVVVCDNTLSASLSEKTDRIKVKHSSRSMNRIGEARDALGLVQRVGASFQAQVEALLEDKVDRPRFARFADAWSGVADLDADSTKRARGLAESRRGSLYQMYQHDDRVTPWAGTAFGVVQAVNTYTHHTQTVRGRDRLTANMDRMVRGQYQALDQGTVDLLATV